MDAGDAVKLCRRLFESEPVISGVEAEFGPKDHEEFTLDLTVLVDGDLWEAERRVIPIILEIMRRLPETPVDFVVLPAGVRAQVEAPVIYERRQNEPV